MQLLRDQIVVWIRCPFRLSGLLTALKRELTEGSRDADDDTALAELGCDLDCLPRGVLEELDVGNPVTDGDVELGR